MRNFIKISAIFLVFFFLCPPLSAADDDPEGKVLQVRALTYMKEKDIWRIEYDNSTVHRVKFPPQTTEELLRQIEKENLESDLPRDQDYARDLGGITKMLVQTFIPLGVPLTTGTGLVAERFLGTSTLVEGAVKYARPMKPTRPVFEGSKRVLNLSGTHRIVNLGLCKPENMRNLHKGQLAPMPPKESLATSFMGKGVTYVEFLMGEDAACQESIEALWEIRTVEVKRKEEKEPHYIIVHSNSGQLLTYTQALWGGPWSGYYCHVEKHPESLEKRFLWDIYYQPDRKVHLLKNVACHPGLLCYTKDQSQNGHYGQVLIQSIGSQLNVEEYYLGGLHRSSIEFRLPGHDNYDKKQPSPSSLLPPPQGNPAVNDSDDFVFDGEGYVSPDPEEREDYLSYDFEQGIDERGLIEEVSLGLANGVYKIRNCDLSSLAKNPDRNPNIGLLLPIISKPSQSGYYAGVLDVQHNAPDQQDLWEIRQAEKEYYTIKSYNHAIKDNGGLLTWVNKSAYSGFYGQVLGDNGSRFFNSYPDEKAKYEQDGEFRNDVLWCLTEEIHNGLTYYTLKNGGTKFESDEDGFLCYTSDSSPVGQYVQILDSSTKYFKQDKEKYKKPGGDYWPSILWQLSYIKSSPS